MRSPHWLRPCAAMLAALLLLLAPLADARGAEAYKPAFRTLGELTGEPALRLDINVWYPGTRAPRELSYTPWTLYAARNGRPAEG
ncbi:MAG: hypothetical protein K2G99_05165, partial [Desulfovibrio sp.]|nr:hypothetical protein [Desulfovibrio sp.]